MTLVNEAGYFEPEQNSENRCRQEYICNTPGYPGIGRVKEQPGRPELSMIVRPALNS